MVIATKQSEKSRQTDLKVAHSAASAVRTVGVDQMALTRVAADAGFSSGAIYARCDDRSELVVMAWEKSFWPMLSEIVSLLADAVISKDNSNMGRIAELFIRSTDPGIVPDLGSAMEVIIASRRDETIGEVVQRDINGLLDDRGVGPSTDGALRQAVVSAISTLFGASLLNSAYVDNKHNMIDPTALIEIFTLSAQSPVKPAKSAIALRNAAPYQFPTTYDDVRDALISASEYVISRTGVHRATVSRIARRAGVSVGAIYGLYENKDALVADCLEVLFLHKVVAMSTNGYRYSQQLTNAQSSLKFWQTTCLHRLLNGVHSVWKALLLHDTHPILQHNWLRIHLRPDAHSWLLPRRLLLVPLLGPKLAYLPVQAFWGSPFLKLSTQQFANSTGDGFLSADNH